MFIVFFILVIALFVVLGIKIFKQGKDIKIEEVHTEKELDYEAVTQIFNKTDIVLNPGMIVTNFDNIVLKIKEDKAKYLPRVIECLHDGVVAETKKENFDKVKTYNELLSKLNIFND